MIRAAWLGLAACALALGVAYVAQHHGLIPCALCRVERWPYRLGIYVALLALLLQGIWRRALTAALLALMLAELGLAGLHVGVEQHWWKSPLAECSAPDLRGLSVAQRLAALPDRPSRSCEEADYPLRAVPVSFVQANFAYALAVSAGIAMCLAGAARRRRA